MERPTMSGGALNMSRKGSPRPNRRLAGLPSLAKALATAFIGVSLLTIHPASADPNMKADDIVAFFKKTAQLGHARGLCIGTEQECDKTAPKPAGLDMMINFDLDSANLTSQAR